jgi:hypothetical protein
MNVKSRQERISVLKQTIEGNTQRGISRITNFDRKTCSRIVVQFGKLCGRLMYSEIRDLTMRHVQVDELFTIVKKHQWNVKWNDPQRRSIGEMAIYIAFDQDTKLVPVHRVGKLGHQTTYRFIYDLRNRIKFPRERSATWPQGYTWITQQPIIRISSDGFSGYQDPIRKAFGPWADYGQIIKKVIRKKGKRKEWLIRKSAVYGDIPDVDISTSLVERCNLSVRTFMASMRRKTLSHAKKLANLEAAANVFFAHYNYCWLHDTIRTSPAHAAGLAPRRFTLDELYDLVHDTTPPLWEDDE